ncbi:MAG TPA: GIY-YIG nuclease family protein [Candidatus Saccharimonadales bacterium]|nr:GIY-YIG nuclease family protein [Candidatus Saccharimonadales bacterium]
MKDYYVYILASKTRGTLYVGVTNDLSARYFQHLANKPHSFTGKYHIHWLVYYESTDNIETAIKREKQLKNWRRQWKINLIESNNPTWQDLAKLYRMGSEINSE